jgi:hypothetical protein
MAVRTTTFPESQESRAFRAIEAILREDPSLIEAGVAFRTWNGDQADSRPIATGECPLLRMIAVAKPAQNFTLATNKSHIGIRLELYVAGTILEDIMGFWAAVRLALTRSKVFRNTTVECYLRLACGSYILEVLQPAYGSWTDSSTSASQLAGVGEAVVSFLVPA